MRGKAENPSLSNAIKCFNDYAYKARKKSLAFDLTFQDFLQLTQQNCFYCGVEPYFIKFDRRFKHQAPFIYNGIDRIDSTNGYCLDNVRTSCARCNYAKNSMTEDEFKALITKIYENYVKKELVNA